MPCKNPYLFLAIFAGFLSLTGCQHTKQSSQQNAKEQSMLRIAQSMHAQGNFKTSYNFYTDVLTNNPKSLDAHIGLMNLALANKEPQEAYKQYQLAVKHVGPSSALDHYLFRIYMALNDVGSAHNHAIELTMKYPKDPKSWRQLGAILDTKQKHAEAQDAYQKSLKINPDSIKTKSNLGMSYALSGNPQEAVKILKAVNMSPHATHRDKHNYVMALVLNNQIEEAELLLAEDMSPSERLETIESLQNFREQLYENGTMK